MNYTLLLLFIISFVPFHSIHSGERMRKLVQRFSGERMKINDTFRNTTHYSAEKMTAKEAQEIFRAEWWGTEICFDCMDYSTPHCIALVYHVKRNRERLKLQEKIRQLEEGVHKKCLPEMLQGSLQSQYEAIKKQDPGKESYWQTLSDDEKKYISHITEQILIEKRIPVTEWHREMSEVYSTLNYTGSVGL